MKKNTSRFMLFVVVFVSAITVYSQTIPFSDLTSQNEYCRGSAMRDIKTIPDKENLSKQILSLLETDTTLSREIQDNLIEVLSISSCTSAIPYIVHYFAVTYSDLDYMNYVGIAYAHRIWSAQRAIKSMGQSAVPYMLTELRKEDTISHIFVSTLADIEGPVKIKEDLRQVIQEEKDTNNNKKRLLLQEFLK